MTSCIPWSPGTRWRKLKGAYSFSLSHDKSSSTGWIHTVHSGADRQPKTKVKRTLSPPQWAQIPHWRRQTRIFHWRTTASMAQLYNIFQSWFLAMNHHDLFDRLLSLAFVFQVWMKTIPKSSSASGLSPVLPYRLWNASFRRWENLSLLQLFVGNSRVTYFQTSDYTIIHLFFFLSVCVFRCLSPGKETALVCPTSMAFPGMLKRSTKWQSWPSPS